MKYLIQPLPPSWEVGAAITCFGQTGKLRPIHLHTQWLRLTESPQSWDADEPLGLWSRALPCSAPIGRSHGVAKQEVPRKPLLLPEKGRRHPDAGDVRTLGTSVVLAGGSHAAPGTLANLVRALQTPDIITCSERPTVRPGGGSFTFWTLPCLDLCN